MKIIRTCLSAVLCVAALAFTSAASAGDAELAPPFRLPSLTGEQVDLASLRGKVVLVNFWASWCPPCREELPELERISREYRDKGVEIVGINIDQEKENALRFVKRFSLTYTILFDENFKVVEEYRAKAMPTSYLIDRDGRVSQVFHGYSKKKLPKMEAAIASLAAS